MCRSGLSSHYWLAVASTRGRLAPGSKRETRVVNSSLFIEYLASVSPQIDEHLHRYLAVAPKGSSLDRYLHGILDEFVMRGGKRTRPAMAMLA